MLKALLFGFGASSALIIGAAIGARWTPPRQLVRVLLAFASGALIAALAFELFDDSFKMGGPWRAGLGLLAGAATFIAIDWLLERRVENQKSGGKSAARGGVGLALLAAVTLDGVPENLALGVTLVGGASFALLVAIFLSNFPEALAGSVEMRKGGMSAKAVMITWSVAAALLAAAAIGGYFVAGVLRPETVALALAFACGAVLASVADTLMPEAFEHGQPLNAFATTGGFFLSYVLSSL
ncbi:ZIP family zinc transporter [Mycolicibacterium chitae]|uniref:Zinc/iron permease n=1 Tax=Mycolicibacterium chitae TaxID=1792 RepID=A0A448IDL2_MYCCI|nr:zinc permease [Mycolicibacterium chitae]MCV7106130.1 zinc permease [Mycolicibacterium chitae]BBZ01675.1 ZIP family zinc transporter [Mycolicibacterium chitae]VEG50511.1 zinc/iron permease [Mycolicibacterium chitae]